LLNCVSLTGDEHYINTYELLCQELFLIFLIFFIFYFMQVE